ncbi:TrmB family transcriptional regulator [Monashia sp. NPDC004114]
MMEADVVRHLQAVGLTEWEARAYLALLEEAPVSGYAVSKRSGVPRSKIYEVLDSLLSKGAVHVARGDKNLYGAIPPQELVQRLRARASQQLDAAESAMSSYAQQVGGNSAIWDLQGRVEILERTKQLIRAATTRIMVEIWAPDSGELQDDLLAASERGVEVIAVTYGEVRYPFAEVHPHPSTDEVTTGLGGRWLVVSADNREIIAGIISSGAQSRAAWTSHQGLVVPITELIAHDLYKLEMLRARGEELEADFGPGLARLRERYSWTAQQSRWR